MLDSSKASGTHRLSQASPTGQKEGLINRRRSAQISSGGFLGSPIRELLREFRQKKRKGIGFSAILWRNAYSLGQHWTRVPIVSHQKAESAMAKQPPNLPQEAAR
jgi:hypothetical protein